jgi:predicted permease
MRGGLRQTWQRIGAFFRGRALDRELRDELATHLQLATDDYARQGMAPAEARRMAALKLGAVDAAREGHRDARGLPTLDSVLKDLGYALRGFRREPGFTGIAVLILALGIGANTAIFSVVNPLLLRPLPFPGSERLTWISHQQGSQQREGDMSSLTFRVATFEEIQRESRSFESLSGYFPFFGFASYALTGQGDPERISGVDIGPRFFEVLGVQPAHGRLFRPEELLKSGPPAAILTHAFWQRRFASNPAIVGQSISINDKLVTVVGVLPEDFDFAATFTPGVRVDFFVPAIFEVMRNWGNTLSLVGRLKPGVTVESARAELDQLMPRLNAAHKEWGGRVGARIVPLKEHVSGPMRRSLIVLWGAVGLVLLIVCANLSNLLLARTSARSKEIAVRMALGAGRIRVIRQLLTEGVVLSLAGAALGVPLAYALTAYLARGATLSVPLLSQVRVDGEALLFTAAIAMTAGVLFGTIPAIRISGRDPHLALKEQNRGSTEGRGHAWVRSALVVAEVTLACVLLIGAGLLLRSFVQLLQVDLGFQPSRASALSLRARTGQTPAQEQALFAEIVRQVKTIPGVDGAGLTDALPFDRNRSWGLAVPGETDDKTNYVGAFVYVVGPGYFDAMGIRLKAGREFGAEDTATSQLVVIVNEALARRLWGNQDPIGRPALGDPKNPYRVVGVVANVRQTGLDEVPVNQMYVAQTQRGGGATDLIVRSTLPAATVASSLRAKLGALDSSLTATDFRPVESLVERAVSPRRFLLTLIAGFSVLAVVLACLGIYGVVSYGVSQREQEIGVRMALGATAANVGRQVIGDTLRLAVIGIALGLVLSLALARLISALLYGTSPTDMTTFGGTAAVLTLVALVAGAIPALRAARIDPMSALRAD